METESQNISTFQTKYDEFIDDLLGTLPEYTSELTAAKALDDVARLSQFQESVTEAHRRWSEKRYNYKAAWDDDAYACALIQLYKKFGGTEKVAPTLLDRFDDLIEFFDTDIMNLVE